MQRVAEVGEIEGAGKSWKSMAASDSGLLVGAARRPYPAPPLPMHQGVIDRREVRPPSRCRHVCTLSPASSLFPQPRLRPRDEGSGGRSPSFLLVFRAPNAALIVSLLDFSSSSFPFFLSPRPFSLSKFFQSPLLFRERERGGGSVARKKIEEGGLVGGCHGLASPKEGTELRLLCVLRFMLRYEPTIT